MKKEALGYLHGFTQEEQGRLYRQARFMEHRIHEGLPFHRARRMLEVGCGVGAQTEILLRRYPELHVTGIDAAEPNLEQARRYLEGLPWARGRFDLFLKNATRLDLEVEHYDSAFLCWILEHVAEPALILSEVRRLLRPGSWVVCTEVQNATFFLDPYAPSTLAYWTSFNDHQLTLGGDPFVGAKLGNLLQRIGYRDVTTEVRTIHLDNRAPVERAEFIAFWADLLLSGADGLRAAGKVTEETIDAMQHELEEVRHNPDAVFFYSFVQARARVP
ncbi:MAG: methyltransferase domain-containing protein [Deltaproteobacteria bacterium]|nr:methyltransferase domain-containing protein [Deltaproteobacteria bacterium]